MNVRCPKCGQYAPRRGEVFACDSCRARLHVVPGSGDGSGEVVELLGSVLAWAELPARSPCLGDAWEPLERWVSDQRDVIDVEFSPCTRERLECQFCHRRYDYEVGQGVRRCGSCGSDAMFPYE